jgi:hypothetical protein
MNLPPPKVCKRILDFYARMMGSPHEHEAEAARGKLRKLLEKHGIPWHQSAELIAELIKADTAKTPPPPPPPTDAPNFNVLDFVQLAIRTYISITPAECIIAALWVLHTYVFDRFQVTPRLAVLSPVRGCGKTVFLDLIEQLVLGAHRLDHTTAAYIYYGLAMNPRMTFLVDEVDNLDLRSNKDLRSVFNSGHRQGGSIARFVEGRPRRYPTFAPMAIAAIGDLPLPLMHRCLIINMQRYARSGDRPEIRVFNKNDPDIAQALAAARTEIWKWQSTCSLALKPDMPMALSNREADNCRVLFAIADTFGVDAETGVAYGEIARNAALELRARRQDEDAGVVALNNIRTVFDTTGTDRITSADLVEAMLAMEDTPGSEWRGVNDDSTPRKLSQGELARLLRPFHIRSRTIWPAHRRPGDKSKRGYLRTQFEAAWAAYCPSTDTATQSGKLRYLRAQ